MKREPDERDGHWISVSPRHHCSDTYLWSLMGFSLLATVLTFWHGFCLDNVSQPPPRRWRTCYRGCNTCFYPPCWHRFPVRERDEKNISESPKASDVFVAFRSVPRETYHRLSSWNVCIVFALQSLFFFSMIIIKTFSVANFNLYLIGTTTASTGNTGQMGGYEPPAENQGPQQV